jgi:hypothetical protein
MLKVAATIGTPLFELVNVRRNFLVRRNHFALAVQTASANQAASMLEQLMVDCGRAYRALNSAFLWRQGSKRC